ncbi:MAG TPA: lysine-sensitive aspartokinase 3 [Aridibacter sp.]|nr:lysine-sensitive aspartokinase 3 [Aridibacter sp.]
MDKKKPTVMKFGGTSVKDPEAFARVASIVKRDEMNGAVVVTSAMAGVTDALLNAFEIAKSGDSAAAFSSLGVHFTRHEGVSSDLLDNQRQKAFGAELKLAKEELSSLLMRVERRSLPLQMLKDAIVAYGEQLSSRLLTEVLRAKGISARHVDARRLIVTDDEYGSAKPLWEETEELVRGDLESSVLQGEIPVMGGFIAANRSGETTTLGRGGSDYSAALVGAALDAREIQIWTDVTGVLTCDPRICADASTIDVLSYNEAAELAYFGAKVLHPKTIQPAVDHGIPVRVCNSHWPEERGTMVLAESGVSENRIKSIAHKTGITILRISSARMLGSYGFMSALFQVFERFRTVIDVISTSEVSVALTLDNTEYLEKVVTELKRLGDVEVEHGYAVVCIVGEGLRDSSGLASKIFSTIDDVNVSLISHGASSVNLTFVVKEEYVREVISRLHGRFFSNKADK